MSAHSEIGPSSADRWMNCPASVKRSRGLKSTTSEFAAEGSVAHQLVEEVSLGKIDDMGLMARIGEVVEQEGHDIMITEEMVKAMKTGSVIVDLAAEQGGNCALTVAGQDVVRHKIVADIVSAYDREDTARAGGPTGGNGADHGSHAAPDGSPGSTNGSHGTTDAPGAGS